MKHDLDSLLARCELPLPVDDIKSLVGVPFAQWKSPATDAWWWTGGHHNGGAKNGIWRRKSAVIMARGRRISPARLLFEFFTQQKLSKKQRIAHQQRGMRGNDRDDVNPAHYIILQPDKKPARSNRRNPHVIQDVVLMMELTDYYPTTTEELLARWPEFKHHRKEDLDETVQTFLL